MRGRQINHGRHRGYGGEKIWPQINTDRCRWEGMVLLKWKFLVACVERMICVYWRSFVADFGASLSIADLISAARKKEPVMQMRWLGLTSCRACCQAAEGVGQM